ncbi:MAG TPA: porin [Polyangiaceae bacterium]|nr:porin [Polyangiaceae bacterium]
MALALVAGTLLAPRPAAAEVTLVKSDPWEVYTSGRVDVFFGYAFGDAKPSGSLKGGGLDASTDIIPKLDAMGNPDPSQQGTISKMRMHSGFVPNVLTVGVRRKMGGDTTLRAQLSLWGTIETNAQRKFLNVQTDFREGYLEAAGGWGTFTAGRFNSLFSRGITETDFLYGHGYGVGFWGGGGTYSTGPTAGLIGFGVLATSFSPGMMYTTPSFGGLKTAVGVFDPVNLPGSWESTRSVRIEDETTFDMGQADSFFKLHLYLNGAYQKVYSGNKDETVRGLGGGFRTEVGNFHLGAGGHYGKGLGLYYALEGSEADTPGAGLPFRTAYGYSVFAQYVLKSVDLNAAFGQSNIKLEALDSAPEHMNDHPIRTQTGISAGVVYHVNESLHLDVDYLRAMFRWYGGAKEDVNYINAGVTLTW